MAGERYPYNWRVCQGLFPLLQEALTVLVGNQKRGINLIRRCAAGHIMDGFAFCAGRLPLRYAFWDIGFNIQLREGDRAVRRYSTAPLRFRSLLPARFPGTSCVSVPKASFFTHDSKW